MAQADLTPIESVLLNYDLEVASHLERLTEQRQIIEMSLNILFQLEFSKFPSEILRLTMADYCYNYGASFDVYHEKTSRAELEREALEDEMSQSIRRSARKRAPLQDVNFSVPAAKAVKGATGRAIRKPAGNEDKENPKVMAPSLFAEPQLPASAVKGSVRKGRAAAKQPEATPLRRSTRNSIQTASSASASSFLFPETPSSKLFSGALQTPLPSKYLSSSVLQTPLQTPGYIDPRLPMTPAGYVPGMMPRVSLIPNAASKVSNVIAVPMKDGNVITLDAAASPSFVNSMNDDTRKELASQLSDLQSQLALMMAQLNS